MCGRFTRMYTWRELWELYMLTAGPPTSNLQPRYNICPTTEIDTIVPVIDKRGVVPMRWANGIFRENFRQCFRELAIKCRNVGAATHGLSPNRKAD
jgi:putative SOS response-associated peptidase YedK